MNTIPYKRFAVWIAISLLSLIGALISVNAAYATNVPSDFTKFISDSDLVSSDDPEETADTLYQWLSSSSSKKDSSRFKACTNTSSSDVKDAYSAGPVNKKVGKDMFASLLSWMDKGAGDLSKDWTDKSNSLIHYINGIAPQGYPTLEDQYVEMESRYESGLCRVILDFAVTLNIPMTATTSTADPTKADLIGKISVKCSTSFGDITNNAIGLPTEISSFLSGLSSSVYDSKVKPDSAKAAGGDGAACEKIATNLKDELLASAGPEIACNQVGYTTASGLDYYACIQGFNNKDNADFCKNEYGDNQQKETVAGHLIVNNVDESSQLAACTAGKTGEPPADAEKKRDCAIDGVGWLACSVMRAMASFNDLMYGVVEGILLTAPLQMYEADGVTPTPQYSVWRAIRDISNVALVAIFLIIIFSQATSIGISSYGVKKMLPRIIIAAVAINLSYFVMQIAVDAANLIGVGLHSFVGGVADKAFDSAGVSWTAVVEQILTGTLAAGTAAGVAGLVIAAGALNTSALGLLALPFIAVAVLSLIAAFVTLFLRNAFIIILVIIAPLAFAAYLLPNTEDLFTRWRKALISLLMLFPTAAILFAGAKLAAYVIMGSRSGLELFFALVIMVMPLFMLPWLARAGGGLLKVVGDRLQGMAKSAKAPLQKALKPYVENQQEKYRSGRGGFFTPFNRQRALDANGNAIKADGTAYKKNASQRWTNARKDMEQQTKNDADRVERNWQQRAIDNPTGKTAQRIADKEDLHKRAEAQEKQFKLHESHRIASDPNSHARTYADQISDAGREQKELDEGERERQNQRVLPNPETGESARSTISGRSLADIERAGITNEAIAKASELKINRNARQNNGDLDRAVVSQKVTQTQIDAIEGRQQSTYDANKTVIGSEAQVAEQEKDFFVRQSESSNAESKEINEEIAEENEDLQDAEKRKFAAEKRTQAITDRQKAEEERRLTEPGEEGGLAEVQAEIDRANMDAENAKNKQASTKEASKLPDGENADLFAESILGKALSDKTTAEQRRIENEARFGVNQKKADGTTLFSQEIERDENGDPKLDANGNEIITGGELAQIRDADQDTQAASAAGAWAEGGKQVQYAAAIDDPNSDRGRKLAEAASGADPRVRNTDGAQKMEPVYEKNPDGTDRIDPATGAKIQIGERPKVAKLTEAKAAKVVLEDKQSDQNTIVSLAKSKNLPNGEALENLGVNINTGRRLTRKDPVTGNEVEVEPPKLTDAEKLGYLRYAAGRGDRQTSMALVSHVGRLGKAAAAARKIAEAKDAAGNLTATPEQIANAEKLTQEAKDAQLVLLEAGDSSLPPWLGGSDRQNLAEGKFVLDYEEAAIAALASGKMTADAFSAMDINNRDAFLKTLETMPDDDVNAIIATTAQKAVSDAASNGHILSEADALEQAKQNFAQAIIPIDKAEFDVRLNRGLAERDKTRYSGMRARLQAIANSDGIERKPQVKDPKTEQLSTYQGYDKST